MSIRGALAVSAVTEPLPHEDGWRRSHRFAVASAVFAGHFPHRPILPAVVQCIMAQMLVEDGLKLPLRLAGIVQAKFIRVTGPDEDIQISVRPATAPKQWDCVVEAAGEVAARIRLHLEGL